MLSLSQTTGYAVRALSCLRHDQPSLIRDLSLKSGVAKPYLAKIVNLLVTKGLVFAKRGYRGGILLARPASQISLLQIVEAVDGQGWSQRCLLGWRDCSDALTCPMHELWAETKEVVRHSLANTTLADVASRSAILRPLTGTESSAPQLPPPPPLPPDNPAPLAFEPGADGRIYVA